MDAIYKLPRNRLQILVSDVEVVHICVEDQSTDALRPASAAGTVHKDFHD